jgi:hypothetical protein
VLGGLWAERRVAVSATTITFEARVPVTRAVPDDEPFLDVSCEEDGSLTVRLDPVTAARLAGRGQFGSVSEAQVDLEERIANAWYAAGCPKRGAR